MNSLIDLSKVINGKVTEAPALLPGEEFKVAWQAYVLENIDNDEEDEEDFSFEQELESEFGPIHITTKPKLVNTPFGIIDVSNEANPYLSYECWIMHTKFTLTRARIRDIMNVPGIEIVKVISRYRVFLGFGKMFKFSDIRKSINDLFGIDAELSMKEVSVQLEELKTSLSTKYPHWIICVFPNGNFKHAFSETDQESDEFRNTVKNFEACKLECPDIVLLKSEQK